MSSTAVEANVAATTAVHLARTTLLATFFVRDALFALDAAGVQEVIRPVSVTPIPHAPSEVFGVVNLRGKIVTLLDTGLLLGFGPTVIGSGSRIFVVEGSGEFIGLLVDRAGEVAEIGGSDIEPLPANVAPAQGRLLLGLCRTGGRVTALLNTALLIAGERTGEACPS